MEIPTLKENKHVNDRVVFLLKRIWKFAYAQPYHKMVSVTRNKITATDQVIFLHCKENHTYGFALRYGHY